MNPSLRDSVFQDIKIARARLRCIDTDWEGKACVLKLKEADYNWKQMEWWAFYFEWRCRNLLPPEFTIPGDRLHNANNNPVVFDSKRTINWDFKAKAIKSDDHKAILNDCSAMRSAVFHDGAYGVIIALCDVEYNDIDRSFQRWHTDLKGGHSDYERGRMRRNATSRYRKTHAILVELLFVVMDEDHLDKLPQMHQGRNSNGKPRPPKYMIDLENLGDMCLCRMSFADDET